MAFVIFSLNLILSASASAHPTDENNLDAIPVGSTFTINNFKISPHTEYESRSLTFIPIGSKIVFRQPVNVLPNTSVTSLIGEQYETGFSCRLEVNVSEEDRYLSGTFTVLSAADEGRESFLEYFREVLVFGDNLKLACLHSAGTFGRVNYSSLITIEKLRAILAEVGAELQLAPYLPKTEHFAVSLTLPNHGESEFPTCSLNSEASDLGGMINGTFAIKKVELYEERSHFRQYAYLNQYQIDLAGGLSINCTGKKSISIGQLRRILEKYEISLSLAAPKKFVVE